MRLGTRAATQAAALLACLALGSQAAYAEKVGVAAAVNPDAYSSLSGAPNKQLSIGKSIFYNERISTDASGVVQVLLVDGSTFTVGANSDLVIDRFVYDPRKKSGEIVATFSKGAMRYIGGKISKNEDGVTVKTPAGSLAIRGGMMQGSLAGQNSIFSFLYGEELTFTGSNGQTQTVYQPGYTLDFSTYPPQIRPTTPEDTARLMAALTNSNTNTAGVVVPNNAPPQPNELATLLSMQQLIADATATQIDGEILRQLQNLQDASNDSAGPTIATTLGGYGATPFFIGEDYGESFYYEEVGLGLGMDPSDFSFDQSTGTTTLTLRNTFTNGETSVGRIVLGYGSTGNPNSNLRSATLFTPSGAPYQTTNAVGFLAAEPIQLCDNCDFIKWGSFGAGVNYHPPEYPYGRTANIGVGWWTAANITAFSQLPQTGSASYAGSAVGSIVTAGEYGYFTQTGRGDLGMTWNFASRRGTLSISNFDVANGSTPLNMSGTMTMPGAVNRFSGNLGGTVGQASATGGAYGSFAAKGSDPAAGVLGSWHARANGGAYQATGIFGGRR